MRQVDLNPSLNPKFQVVHSTRSSVERRLVVLFPTPQGRRAALEACLLNRKESNQPKNLKRASLTPEEIVAPSLLNSAGPSHRDACDSLQWLLSIFNNPMQNQLIRKSDLHLMGHPCWGLNMI